MMDYDMKSQIGLIFLGVICVGLGLGLVMTHKQARERHFQDAASIEEYSNQWVNTKSKYEDQIMLSSAFEKDLEKQKRTLVEVSNTLAQTSANLEQASTSLIKNEATLKADEEEIRKRDAKITELETQNRTLDQRASELCDAITNLTTAITDLRHQLSGARSDKNVLEQKLRQMLADKADLERQFSDLSVVRAQVAKLKEQLVIVKRREWIHQGLIGDEDQRGAQRLMQGTTSSSRTPPAPKPAYDLNVEVGSDGSVRIVQPTNAPSATNPPAK